MSTTTERKAKRKIVQQKIVAQYEGNFAGAEPSFDETQKLWSDQDRRNALLCGYNYYKAAWSPDTRRKIFSEHLKTANAQTIILSTLKDWEIPQSVVALMTMRDRGLLLTKKEQAYLIEELAKLENLCRNREEAKKDDKPKKTIQDRIDGQTAVYIGAIEEKIDAFIFSGCKGTIALNDWFTEQNVKGVYAKRIAQFFSRNRDEIYDAIKKRDAQLVEGYANYGPTKLKALHGAYAAIVTDAENWGGIKKQERKPTKRRTKSVDSRLRWLKYLPTDADYKLTSIAPAKLLGAGNLWAFNVKTRQLAWYHAKDADGLDLKGTTLQNFDEEKSGLKKLRKPDAVLYLIMGGQRAAEKAFADVHAKVQKATGRLNKYTLLLRAHNVL